MKLHYIEVITRFLLSPRLLLLWIIVTTLHIPHLTPADMDLCITEVRTISKARLQTIGKV